MKNYSIITLHDVYVDSYTDGELSNVNYYTTKSEQKAANPIEAIKKHFDSICLSFNVDDANIDKKQNLVFYSNLVDDNNSEASESEISKWKENELKLYSNNTATKVFEFTKVIF